MNSETKKRVTNVLVGNNRSRLKKYIERMSETDAPLKQRINSVDLLRGLVMIVMLLDHTREFVNADAFLYSPTDLSKTNVALFFTRWITHFSAPAFVFISGTSIYLQLLRGKSRRNSRNLL